MRRKVSDKKSCNSCGETDISKLVVDNSRPQGCRNECKICRKKSYKSGSIKDHHLRRNYGMTLEDFNRMVIEQNGCCLICKKHQSELTNSLNVDHCHITGKVRGLLCGNCNAGIGNLKDSIGLLVSAIEYLKKYV